MTTRDTLERLALDDEITLRVARRPGGYLFVTARGLPGFSLMLTPEQARPIIEPLIAFSKAGQKE